MFDKYMYMYVHTYNMMGTDFSLETFKCASFTSLILEKKRRREEREKRATVSVY